MKIAALYDIHGNLPALDAVLAELDAVQPDVIVIGGDIIWGPMPRQTWERLNQLGERARWLRGNCDRENVMAFDGQPFPSATPANAVEQAHWVAGQLTRAQRDALAQMPEHLTFPIDGLGDVLFCHATPRNDEEIFTPDSTPERLAAIFGGVAQQVVVCGHTHVQFEMHVGNTLILNAGSVGSPYAAQPGAYWLLLSPQVYEFRRTDYDVEAAAREIAATAYPQAHEFAEENVRHVPSAAEALAVFERVARGG